MFLVDVQIDQAQDFHQILLLSISFGKVVSELDQLFKFELGNKILL